MRCKLIKAAPAAPSAYAGAEYDETTDRYVLPDGTVAAEYDETTGRYVRPAGTVIDHPDAWKHCVPGYANAPAIAEPADDEAVEAAKAHMESRNKSIDLIRRMKQEMPKKPRGRQAKAAKKHVDQMAEAYGVNDSE